MLVEAKKAEDEGPSTWRAKLALVLLLGVGGYSAYKARERALLDVHREIVSVVPNEVHDLINVFQFTTRDMESLYVKTMRRYPRGEVNLDDFAQMIADQVALVRERRRQQRYTRNRQREEEQHADDVAEVRLERDIARAQLRAKAGHAGAAAELASLEEQLKARMATNEAAAHVRAVASAGDESEALADDHVDNAYNPLDAWVFYRTCTPKRVGRAVPYQSAHLPKPQSYDLAALEARPRQLMDVRDLMVGLANVLFDHAELAPRFAERAGGKNMPASLEDLQRTWTSRDIEVFTRRPESRLHFAFRVADEDRDGQLSFGQLEALLERLLRTGHFKAESLLRIKQQAVDVPEGCAPWQRPSPRPFPVEFEPRSAAEIARDYWAHIQDNRRVQALEQFKQQLEARKDGVAAETVPAPARAAGTAASARARTAAAAAPAVLDLSPVYSPSTTLSWPELEAASRHFARTGQSATLWYMHDTAPNGGPLGSFAKFRSKWAARFRQRWNRVPLPDDEAAIEQSALLAFATP